MDGSIDAELAGESGDIGCITRRSVFEEIMPFNVKRDRGSRSSRPRVALFTHFWLVLLR